MVSYLLGCFWYIFGHLWLISLFYLTGLAPKVSNHWLIKCVTLPDVIKWALEDNKSICASTFQVVIQASTLWHQGLEFKLNKHLPHQMSPLLNSDISDSYFRKRVYVCKMCLWFFRVKENFCHVHRAVSLSMFALICFTLVTSQKVKIFLPPNCYWQISISCQCVHLGNGALRRMKSSQLMLTTGMITKLWQVTIR